MEGLDREKYNVSVATSDELISNDNSKVMILFVNPQNLKQKCLLF